MASLLVVEDDTEVLGAMCAVLTAAGHNVLPAEGDLRALDILDTGEQVLGLMLTEIVMPGLHGFNLSRMARLRRPAILPGDLRRAVTEALATAPTEH